ncbi:MAG TPA: hypothetical protein VMW75_14540 [Thermoanaerobaculia bacterium]|nr:hypothetical protein [Thermoanaerobaculia bacterium]
MIFERTRGPYRQFGFSPLANPDRHMEILKPDLYRQPSGAGDSQECQETP